MRFVVYGRTRSPYARRVMVWARLQGHEIDQRDLAPAEAEDFATLQKLYPAGRVPVLEREDGSRLFESWMICDWLDSIAAPEQRMLPSDPDARLRVTQLCGLANTATEKMVARVYEGRRPKDLQWENWRERVTDQTLGALDMLEAETPAEGFFGGERPNAADILSVITVDMIAFGTPALLEGRAEKLKALAGRADRLAEFAETRP